MTVYLFDWGDTLMEDLPGMTGDMKDWPRVAAVEDAPATLRALAEDHRLYVATGAPGTRPAKIEAALARVGLAPFFDGYFCPANTGRRKPDPAFYRAILDSLGLPAAAVTMVGDSLEQDILPARGLGIGGIWLNRRGEPVPEGVRAIARLGELLLPAA